jgi:hypothetical protein
MEWVTIGYTPADEFGNSYSIVIPSTAWESANLADLYNKIYTQDAEGNTQLVTKSQLASWGLDLNSLRQAVSFNLMKDNLTRRGIDPLVLNIPEVADWIEKTSLYQTPGGGAFMEGLISQLGKVSQNPTNAKTIMDEITPGNRDLSLSPEEAKKKSIGQAVGREGGEALVDFGKGQPLYQNEGEKAYRQSHKDFFKSAVDPYRSKFESPDYNPTQLGNLDEQVAYAYYLSTKNDEERINALESGGAEQPEFAKEGWMGGEILTPEQQTAKQRSEQETEWNKLSRKVRYPRRLTTL